MTDDDLEDLVALEDIEGLDTPFALAYREAIHVRRVEDEERAAAAERRVAALAEEQVYDPDAPPPTSSRWRPDQAREAAAREAKPYPARDYEGTGIGALYGLPDCERFLPELGDWKVVTRRVR